jgi:hypothetical protein
VVVSEMNVIVKSSDGVLPSPAVSWVTFSGTWIMTVPSDAPFVTENVYTAPVPVREPESMALMLAEPDTVISEPSRPVTGSENVMV